MSVDPVLRVEDLTKSFGGLTAVDGVSFEVDRGQITGLIGPNGAGKTTMFNLLSDYLQPTSGEIYFQGDQINNLTTHQRAHRGLVRTFQITRELQGLSVLDNMLLATLDHPGEKVVPALVNSGSVQSHEEANYKKAKEWLERLELWELRNEYAGNLSGGQRKLLELGRVLMLEPDLLLLDEPLAGVNPTLSEKLLNHIKRINESGVTFVLVEHDMDVIMSISDEIIGLHNGSVLARGLPEEVQQDEEMLEAYLGD